MNRKMLLPVLRAVNVWYKTQMLDIRYVADNLGEVEQALARRGFRDRAALERISVLAHSRRRGLAETETLRAQRNEASAQMANADKKSPDFESRRTELRELGERIKELEAAHSKVEAELEDELLHLPNLPHPSTPSGTSEADNPVVRTWGTKPALRFEPRDHVDIGTQLGIMDFGRAAKISGARFVVLRGLGSKLERALMQFMLDMHTDQHGYTEVWTPVIVKDSAMRGTGQLPKFAMDAFRLAKDEEWANQNEASYDLYLIPTAEVSVTNLHADEILDGADLPLAYTAYTPCFRREAGSHGRDTRGMIRQHQFDKVELVRFATPETAEEQLEILTGHAERILQALNLHYRVVQLCGGDLGFGSQKTYDLEVWLPSQNVFREISSCSWFGDFQARRMSCRYRVEPKAKPRLVHTLNGSGVAIGRALIAILEQNQLEDGRVRVPEALRPYFGGRSMIE